MSRFIMLVFISIFAFNGLAGCATQENQTAKIDVVTSFFPLYDFARIIGGEYVHVTNMIPAGVEPHDWTPKSRDMTSISKAKVFVYQGAGFEGWTDDVLDGLSPDRMVIVEASQGIELLPAAPEHDHNAYDPHTWLSPKSAITMAKNILSGMKQADPDHADEFDENYNRLVADLEALDQKFTKQLSGLSRKEMIVSHQAFGYLARDYGLVQMPMMGIAAESEPTSKDLMEISEFVKEHDVQYIFTEQLLSDALARTLADDLGVATLPLHPLEGLTPEEVNRSETYISIMEQNLLQLIKALQ